MQSIDYIYKFLYNKLHLYYQDQQLSYFVFNQLFKQVTNKDFIFYKSSDVLEIALSAILENHVNEITIYHKPYQYILQEVSFCNVAIAITPPVLIPRAETEFLVSWLLNKLSIYEKNYFKIADFCSGSGCIGIALAVFFKNSYCTAFDISHDAVKLSALNAIRNNIKNRYKIIQKDILNFKKNKKYDIIISNPPYISFNNYQKLDKSVLLWEDMISLTDKGNGSSVILHIIKISKKKLFNDGIIIIEIDDAYADFILQEAHKLFPKNLVFLWADQYKKSRAIIIVKGKFISLFLES